MWCPGQGGLWCCNWVTNSYGRKVSVVWIWLTLFKITMPYFLLKNRMSLCWFQFRHLCLYTSIHDLSKCKSIKILSMLMRCLLLCLCGTFFEEMKYYEWLIEFVVSLWAEKLICIHLLIYHLLIFLMNVISHALQNPHSRHGCVILAHFSHTMERH